MLQQGSAVSGLSEEGEARNEEEKLTVTVQLDFLTVSYCNVPVF